MKALLMSSNKNSLCKLHSFSLQFDTLSQSDFVLMDTQSYLAIDVLKTVKSKLNLDEYELVILSDKDRDHEIASGLAVYLKTGCSTKCTDLIIENDSIQVMREVFGGLANLQLMIQKKPYIITISSSYLNDMPSETDWDGYENILSEKTTLTFELLDSKKIEKTVDLTRANTIVSVGRGIDKEENIEIVEQLTKVLNAEIGCSRPISEDFKWLPVERQVGLTGETVKPNLYIAIGISGQVQHVVGMRDSKIVIAINNNKSAPIFEYCDYGIIGDLFDIVPVLTKKIENLS